MFLNLPYVAKSNESLGVLMNDAEESLAEVSLMNLFKDDILILEISI